VAQLRGFRFPARPAADEKPHVRIIFVCSTNVCSILPSSLSLSLSLSLCVDRSGTLLLRKASALSPNDSAIHKFREDGCRNDVPAAPSSAQTTYFIRAYAPDVDGRIHEAVLSHGTASGPPSAESISGGSGATGGGGRGGAGGLRDFARKKRRGEALFCLRQETRLGRDDRVTPRRLPPRECRARALPHPLPPAAASVSLSLSLSLSPAVSCHLSYIFSLFGRREGGPCLFLRSDVCEIRRSIWRSFTCQNALSYRRRVRDGCRATTLQRFHPAFPCRPIVPRNREGRCV